MYFMHFSSGCGISYKKMDCIEQRTASEYKSVDGFDNQNETNEKKISKGT